MSEPTAVTDELAILKLGASANLDVAYLNMWAAHLGVAERTAHCAPRSAHH